MSELTAPVSPAGGLGRSGRISPHTLRLAEESPEFAVYSALKLYICRRAAFHQRGRREAEGESVPLTARRLHHLLFARTDPANGPPAPLYGVSSYFLRERLKALNHGTALTESGRGLRNSVTYQWSEPLDQGVMQSYQRLESVLGERVTMGFDLHLIEASFGRRPFTIDQFVAEAMRRRQVNSGPGLTSSPKRASVGHTRFLRQRLAEIGKLGMLSRNRNHFCLTERGEVAAHWFDLFVGPVGFSRPGKPPKRRRRETNPGRMPDRFTPSAATEELSRPIT